MYVFSTGHWISRIVSHMSGKSFQCKGIDGSKSRRGAIFTPHGNIETPFFMPIATRAAVKTLSSVDIEHLGSPILLSNTFHLMLRPGMDVMKEMGGLHAFMGWNGAILTDSGGFQVFSLANRKKITEENVVFQSPIDGSRQILNPELSMRIQRTLGSDIMMCFDDVIGLPAPHKNVEEAMERSLRWAKRCKVEFEQTREGSLNPNAQLFGIIQGGTSEDLRKRSAEGLLKIGFDGYAIGGLSVGEPFEDALHTLDVLMPLLPESKPRYFMGGAQPDQLIEYVRRGVDMFDCVLPTRNARHGHLYRFVHTDLTKRNFFEVINITNEQYKYSKTPLVEHIEGDSISTELSRFTLGYLRHLFSINEVLAYRLATMANVRFYLDLMRQIRMAIKEGQI